MSGCKTCGGTYERIDQPLMVGGMVLLQLKGGAKAVGILRGETGRQWRLTQQGAWAAFDKADVEDIYAVQRADAQAIAAEADEGEGQQAVGGSEGVRQQVEEGQGGVLEDESVVRQVPGKGKAGNGDGGRPHRATQGKR